ncbi:MAG: hypothetical protein J6X19_00040 [Clostridia bacterium]|nr:hypothetical protein [Clostridia bacterium]
MNLWKFDLTQYASVWSVAVNIGLLLIALLIGNALRRLILFLRKAFIPSALIGGLLLFLANLFTVHVLDFALIDARLMQIITYHTLCVGFIAMSLKSAEKAKGVKKGLRSVQNGLLTGGTYMLQAVVGLGISVLFYLVGSGLFYDSGVILPLGFGQGPGNALTWDINFTDYGFDGGGSFGLTIASIGFIVASVVGVLYINFYKRKGAIQERRSERVRLVSDFEDNNEIDDCESVDKTSVQVAFVAVAYALSFGIMCFFAKLTDWTGVKLFNDIAWGFNFIWGVITATLIRVVMRKFEQHRVVKQKYINNYQMDRISGFAFDMMIIAGVAAIDIKVVAKYAWVIAILCAVGAVVTLVYVRMICRRCFKGFEHEAFLVNFGTLTGTASNGMILLREIDPDYVTPTSSIFILSQFPAMVAVAPLLLLLNMSARSFKGCLIALAIFFVLFAVYTTVLFITSRRNPGLSTGSDPEPDLENDPAPATIELPT